MTCWKKFPGRLQSTCIQQIRDSSLSAIMHEWNTALRCGHPTQGKLMQWTSAVPVTNDDDDDDGDNNDDDISLHDGGRMVNTTSVICQQSIIEY